MISKFNLHLNLTLPSARYWEKNMRLMHGIAVENNYLLLDCFNLFWMAEQIAVYQDQIERYKKSYPALCKAAGNHPEFLVDFLEQYPQDIFFAFVFSMTSFAAFITGENFGQIPYGKTPAISAMNETYATV